MIIKLSIYISLINLMSAMTDFKNAFKELEKNINHTSQMQHGVKLRHKFIQKRGSLPFRTLQNYEAQQVNKTMSSAY